MLPLQHNKQILIILPLYDLGNASPPFLERLHKAFGHFALSINIPKCAPHKLHPN